MDRAERVGYNEALFRDVNERIGGLQADFGRTATMEIVCECGDDRCMERINVRPEQYRTVREDPRRFILLPGHDLPDVESVVEDHDRFVIVEKHPGDAARVAEETA